MPELNFKNLLKFQELMCFAYAQVEVKVYKYIQVIELCCGFRLFYCVFKFLKMYNFIQLYSEILHFAFCLA